MRKKKFYMYFQNTFGFKPPAGISFFQVFVILCLHPLNVIEVHAGASLNSALALTVDLFMILSLPTLNVLNSHWSNVSSALPLEQSDQTDEIRTKSLGVEMP